MKIKRYPAMASLLLVLLLYLPGLAAEPEAEEKEITERIIEIKGTLERPRVIFIVPKARLQKEARAEEEALKKSFVSDILKPVYPEFLIKEEGIYNPARR